MKPTLIDPWKHADRLVKGKPETKPNLKDLPPDLKRKVWIDMPDDMKSFLQSMRRFDPEGIYYERTK